MGAEGPHHVDGELEVGPRHRARCVSCSRRPSAMAGAASSRPEANWLDASAATDAAPAGQPVGVDRERAAGRPTPSRPERAQRADEVGHGPLAHARRAVEHVAPMAEGGHRGHEAGRGAGLAHVERRPPSPGMRPPAPVDRHRRAGRPRDADAEAAQAVRPWPRCRRRPARRGCVLRPVGQGGGHERPVGDALRARAAPPWRRAAR